MPRSVFETSEQPYCPIAFLSRGRWKSVCEPPFPGYVFIELGVDLNNTLPFRSTRGVVGIVLQGATLLPFLEDMLEELRIAQATIGGANEPARLFEVRKG